MSAPPPNTPTLVHPAWRPGGQGPTCTPSLVWAINKIHDLVEKMGKLEEKVATVDALEEKVAKLELYVKDLEALTGGPGAVDAYRAEVEAEKGADLKGEDSTSSEEELDEANGDVDLGEAPHDLG